MQRQPLSALSSMVRRPSSKTPLDVAELYLRWFCGSYAIAFFLDRRSKTGVATPITGSITCSRVPVLYIGISCADGRSQQ